jgi:hypothetical protein
LIIVRRSAFAVPLQKRTIERSLEGEQGGIGLVQGG